MKVHLVEINSKNHTKKDNLGEPEWIHLNNADMNGMLAVKSKRNKSVMKIALADMLNNLGRLVEPQIALLQWSQVNRPTSPESLMVAEVLKITGNAEITLLKADAGSQGTL